MFGTVTSSFLLYTSFGGISHPHNLYKDDKRNTPVTGSRREGSLLLLGLWLGENPIVLSMRPDALQSPSERRQPIALSPHPARTVYPIRNQCVASATRSTQRPDHEGGGRSPSQFPAACSCQHCNPSPRSAQASAFWTQRLRIASVVLAVSVRRERSDQHDE